jgi:hypothetical protein
MAASKAVFFSKLVEKVQIAVMGIIPIHDMAALEVAISDMDHLQVLDQSARLQISPSLI